MRNENFIHMMNPAFPIIESLRDHIFQPSEDGVPLRANRETTL
jgi:hypothetical protein